MAKLKDILSKEDARKLWDLKKELRKGRKKSKHDDQNKEIGSYILKMTRGY